MRQIKRRKKRRSRQKNIRKDTRPESERPSYLTEGAADYVKPGNERFGTRGKATAADEAAE